MKELATMEDFLYYVFIIVCLYIAHKTFNSFVNKNTRTSPKFVVVKTIGQTGNNETNLAQDNSHQEINKNKPNDE